MGINFFEDINKQLGGLLQQRLQNVSPQNQLNLQLRQLQIQGLQQEQFKAEALSNILRTEEIDPNDPESTVDFVTKVTSVDDRFIPLLVGTLQTHVNSLSEKSLRLEKEREEKEKQQATVEFAEELKREKLGTTAKVFKASARGVDIPKEVINLAFKRDIGFNENLSRAEKIKMKADLVSKGFEPSTVDEFVRTGDSTVLKATPEAEKKGKTISPAALVKFQQQLQDTDIFGALVSERTGGIASVVSFVKEDVFGEAAAKNPSDILAVQNDILVSGLNEERAKKTLGRDLTEKEKKEIEFINSQILPRMREFNKQFRAEDSETQAPAQQQNLELTPERISILDKIIDFNNTKREKQGLRPFKKTDETRLLVLKKFIGTERGKRLGL